MSPQASPHVSSCVLPYQLSLSPKRAHAQHLLCLQGKHLADRQVKYDPKSLRASADLPLSSMSFGLCPNGMKTWQKNVQTSLSPRLKSGKKISANQWWLEKLELSARCQAQEGTERSALVPRKTLVMTVVLCQSYVQVQSIKSDNRPLSCSAFSLQQGQVCLCYLY